MLSCWPFCCGRQPLWGQAQQQRDHVLCLIETTKLHWAVRELWSSERKMGFLCSFSAAFAGGRAFYRLRKRRRTAAANRRYLPRSTCGIRRLKTATGCSSDVMIAWACAGAGCYRFRDSRVVSLFTVIRAGGCRRAKGEKPAKTMNDARTTPQKEDFARRLSVLRWAGPGQKKKKSQNSQL